MSHPVRLELAIAEREVAAAELHIQTRRASENEAQLLDRRRDTAESALQDAERAQGVADASHPAVLESVERFEIEDPDATE